MTIRTQAQRGTMRAVAIAALAIVAAAVGAAPALADDRADCTGTSDPPIEACTRAIQSGEWHDHDLAALHVARGFAYLARIDLGQALPDFNAAIRIDPSDAEAYRGRAGVYGLQPANAIVDLDEAIRLDPNDVAAYVDRGGSYRALGELDRAIADYDAAIRRDATVARAYAGRGRAFRAKGALDRAIADYDAALGIDPKQHFVYLDRGAAYQAKGDLDRAIADYDTALRLGPFTRAYELRGSAYQAKGDLGRAIADYSEAIRLNPRDVAALHGRGLARQAKSDAEGDAVDAAADLARARELSSIVGLPIATFTRLHVAIGLVAVLAGALVLAALLRRRVPRLAGAIFLAAAAATGVTGLLFHDAPASPALEPGLMMLVAVAIALLALAVGRIAGRWRWIYVLAMLGALYLAVDIGIMQTLVRAPSLLFLVVPRSLDQPMLAAQIGIAAVFLVLTIIALARWRQRAGLPG